jgi:hypothetical protein
VELGIKLTAPTNNDDEDIRNSWEQKSKEQEHRIASWVLELKDVAKKRKVISSPQIGEKNQKTDISRHLSRKSKRF